MDRNQLNEFRKLFTMQHLLLDYLPKRLALYVIPPAIVIAIVLGKRDQSYAYFFVGYCILMAVAQVSNYFICWHRHNEWEARYGDQYRVKLEEGLRRFGLNRLIGRFWADMRIK